MTHNIILSGDTILKNTASLCLFIIVAHHAEAIIIIRLKPWPKTYLLTYELSITPHHSITQLYVALYYDATMFWFTCLYYKTQTHTSVVNAFTWAITANESIFNYTNNNPYKTIKIVPTLYIISSSGFGRYNKSV